MPHNSAAVDRESLVADEVINQRSNLQPTGASINISTLRKDIDGYGFQSGRVKDKGQDVTNEDINTTHYVILYPKDRNRDPDGDVQSSLQWKTRTIITSQQEEQTFFYAELNENDYIKLTKKNSKRKLLYNNELCQLEFRTTFKIIGHDFEEALVLNSQLFGLCSHAKYYPISLAKVFIEEVSQLHKNNILEKLFTQIKFLGNHPFLAMILFHGICSDRVDKKISDGTQQIPQMIMRFEQFKNKKTEHPNIIFAFYDGTLRKARTTHEYFIEDICRCLCNAASNDRNPLQVFNDNKTIPFFYFRWYHDNDLNRNNLMQIDDETIFYPLQTLLQNTILQLTWMNLLNRERRNLKPNINSVAKCFMINRLIAECKKDPCQFARQTGELYEEIKMRISCITPSAWTVEDFYDQIELWQNLQSHRRLFHINHDEANRPQSLLTLQQIATKIYSHCLSSCQRNFNDQNYDHLKKLLQHSFIIIAQPSFPECVVAAKYDKSGNTYSAKLHTRIICLLEPDIVEKNLIFANVAVTLFPFDRNLDLFGEEQPTLKWHKRQIIDPDNILRSFFYVELESIKLKKLDRPNSRPMYNGKMCQLEFKIKIRINELNIEENHKLTSEQFGICSHAQYYPEYVAQVLLHQVEQISQSNNSIIQPNTLTNYILRYYTRVSGMEAKLQTTQYITDVLQTVYEKTITSKTTTSFNIYQNILAKLISQMEMFVDYPFLSMMYHDGLFLGINNNTLDQQLHGTRQRPHMLFRFNSLTDHHSTQHASVRFIVHNGQLTKATFHAKAFIDEMCQMICEANSHEAMNRQFRLAITDRNFHEFNIELFRLSATVSQFNDAYQPLIPVLWDTMRTSAAEQQLKQNEQQMTLSNSLSFDLESMKEDVSQSNTSSTKEIQLDLSNMTVTNDHSKRSNEKVNIQTDMLAHHVVEKLSNLLMNSSTETISSTPNDITIASTFLSTLTNENIQEQKQILFHLLNDYFQSKTCVDVATQTSLSVSNNSSDSIFDNT
ncbi:unnamed protein product [Rotaria sp. Silwood2]|nr:unnamed protein product [Rotaria sp. Silwood2]